MTNDFFKLIDTFAEVSSPGCAESQLWIEGSKLPDAYVTIISRTNGFTCSEGTFRLFAYGANDKIVSAQAWNNTGWKKAYGNLADGFVSIAEDIFGDQYGYFFDGRIPPRFCKFFVEGGKIQQIAVELPEFLMQSVLQSSPVAYDIELARQALRRGMKPSIREHLAFSLPLICGGERQVSNLGVENSIMHLELLGQLSVKIKSLPAGTRIKEFRQA